VTAVKSALIASWALAACLSTQPARAGGPGDEPLAGALDVAGTRLVLNGAGLARRYFFDVYAIGLYLPAAGSSVEQVLSCDGARRIAIRLLRDVSGDDFRQAMAEASEAASHAEEPPPPERVARLLDGLGRTLASRPQGLRKGDRLTLDWVPGTGVVVEINRASVAAPVHDKGFYEALLNVWLGGHSRDPALRRRLLGAQADTAGTNM
jgi:hypothetical protein